MGIDFRFPRNKNKKRRKEFECTEESWKRGASRGVGSKISDVYTLCSDLAFDFLVPSTSFTLLSRCRVAWLVIVPHSCKIFILFRFPRKAYL